MKQCYTYLLFFAIYLPLWVGCSPSVDTYSTVDRYAEIHPAYEGTVIPYNIAPLNFQIREHGEQYLVRFVAATDSFEVSTRKNVRIPQKKWRTLLENNKNGIVSVRIFSKEKEGWVSYKNRQFSVAAEPIDPYVAYRLIEPGYELWNRMGIYQRCLENFEESPVMVNTMTDMNCMNCHSFCNNDPETMLFHMRGEYAGTLIAKSGDVKKVNTKASWMPSAGVYPRWHPEGRYIAFSTNTTRQEFHAIHTNKVEVFDTESDLVLYDTHDNRIYTDSLICSGKSFETFPEWSPDGRYLYFCSAPAMKMPSEYKKLKYDLLRVAFDPQTQQFGQTVDTLVAATKTGQSVSMPRISPDGKYVVFCMSDYGTFPIWHRENDLYIFHTETGQQSNLTETNSPDQSDSYHSWSSNGRWLVFGSRRFDGNYTRLYIAYIAPDGQAHKAFLLPQKDPEFYDLCMKSYNIPECITGKINYTPNHFYNAAQTQPLQPQSVK